MLIKITVQGGIVQDIETSEPALVQIVDLDAAEISVFETVAQFVAFASDTGSVEKESPDEGAAILSLDKMQKEVL